VNIDSFVYRTHKPTHIYAMLLYYEFTSLHVYFYLFKKLHAVIIGDRHYICFIVPLIPNLDVTNIYLFNINNSHKLITMSRDMFSAFFNLITNYPTWPIKNKYL
jgi:hypothetical protein